MLFYGTFIRQLVFLISQFDSVWNVRLSWCPKLHESCTLNVNECPHTFFHFWWHPSFNKLRAAKKAKHFLNAHFSFGLGWGLRRHLCPSPELLATVGLTSTRHNTGRWPLGALGQSHHNHSSVRLAFASLSASLSAAAPASPRRRKAWIYTPKKSFDKKRKKEKKKRRKKKDNETPVSGSLRRGGK